MEGFEIEMESELGLNDPATILQRSCNDSEKILKEDGGHRNGAWVMSMLSFSLVLVPIAAHRWQW